MRQPRPQAFGARGAPNLTLGFAAKPSPSAPWAQGLLSAFWERGSPDLPAYGLQRGSRGGPAWPIFINTSSRPSRGAKPRGADAGGFLGHGLVRLAREEEERSRWGTSRGAHDSSHDDQGRQAGASPHSVLLSSLVQREQVQARASSKGIHFSATRPRPAQRQEGSHCGAQDGVTTRAFCRRRPLLSG